MSSEERKAARAERKEGRFENRQIDEAVVDVDRALNQFEDLGVKIDKDEPNLAASHLRRALKDISKAATHLDEKTGPAEPRCTCEHIHTIATEAFFDALAVQ